MGFPGWFRIAAPNMLKGIFHIMIFKGHRGVGAWVKRGVPQGDPLSMFFFCIVMDVLLSGLEKLMRKGELVCAFADDLAFILRSLVRVTPVVRLALLWSRAATVESNIQKSRWVWG